jgi:hypothetical protein
MGSGPLARISPRASTNVLMPTNRPASRPRTSIGVVKKGTSMLLEMGDVDSPMELRHPQSLGGSRKVYKA